MTKRNRFSTILLTLIALCAILFSFAACQKKNEYPEIASSKKEATVVAVLGGHEVKYELFRAYFSAMYSGRTDGMTEEGWNEAKIAVLREIAELYATLDVAEENGVNPYGSEINDEVAEMIRVDYEGGFVNGGDVYIEGAGSRAKYKEALAAANLTDAVNRLNYRCSAVQNALYDYLVANLSRGTKDPATLPDARDFFISGACAHGVLICVQDELRQGRENARAFAVEMRDRLSDAAGYDDVKAVFIATFSDQALDDNSVGSVDQGFYFSENQGNTPLVRALISDLFSLEPYSCGEFHEDVNGVWFAVGLPKNAADYDRFSDGFYNLMVAETWINHPIVEKANAYLSGVTYSSAFPTFSAETIEELTVE